MRKYFMLLLILLFNFKALSMEKKIDVERKISELEENSEEEVNLSALIDKKSSPEEIQLHVKEKISNLLDLQEKNELTMELVNNFMEIINNNPDVINNPFIDGATIGLADGNYVTVVWLIWKELTKIEAINELIKEDQDTTILQILLEYLVGKANPLSDHSLYYLNGELNKKHNLLYAFSLFALRNKKLEQNLNDLIKANIGLVEGCRSTKTLKESFDSQEKLKKTLKKNKKNKNVDKLKRKKNKKRIQKVDDFLRDVKKETKKEINEGENYRVSGQNIDFSQLNLDDGGNKIIKMKFNNIENPQ